MSELSELRQANGQVQPAWALVRALQRENEQLREALAGQTVIEQAKGAMSGRFGILPHEAYELLHALARAHERELEDFAAEVVRNGGRLDGDAVGAWARSRTRADP